MALLGAPAHELLRAHFNSSSVREYQTVPAAPKDAAALRNPTKVRFPQLGFQDLSANSVAGYGENSLHSRRYHVNSASSNSSASASSALQEQVEILEKEVERETEKEMTTLTETVTSDPSCPLPDVPSSLVQVTLLNPLKSSQPPYKIPSQSAPLLVYVPGMDCTGQGIRRQLPSLVAAGYDIRCVFIPSDDRSSWQQLVQTILPLMEKEVETTSGKPRQLTVLGESFGGCLAIRLAQAAQHIVSRLVLINPATNFAESNAIASFAARTGLLAAFPEPLYQVAQDIMLPLMVRKGRVSRAGNEDMLSPIDYVPAQCAAWRFSMLNDSTGLSDREVQEIRVPTLLFASAKDRVLWSTTECLRLQKLLPNSKRVVMAESGHTLLFEDSIDLAFLLDKYGFSPPHTEMSSSDSPTASDSNGASHSAAERKEGNSLQSRKHAVSDERYDEMGLIIEPWRILTSPYVTGAESLPNPEMKPKRPVLFVGNHTMFGIYDSPILVRELYTRGFRLRGLAHPGHWATGVGPVFERYGNVKATKMAAYKLLKDGEDVLLFPGGAREVCKRKGEEYKLMWKETVDFVRMASRLNAIIVPFGILGADDAYKILYDGDDFLNSPLGPLIKSVYERFDIGLENIYPLTALPGLGLPSIIPIPSVERIYIHFSEPVDTQEYKCNLRDKEQCMDLYMLVKGRVEDAITSLKQTRDQDSERSLPTRLLGKIGRLLPERKP
ncbi:hypothetical protein KC19_1G171700 [Ceratodon purpureus]|uniref:Phospholipid/glycerol acyltransferase domain-containing protein n=1 Tax=Ceratodon purpureus TaxID=3225 RepID=A0A8T0J6X9_CERPU|nr:hypothetical protein KC19_1G171700 [Ceratodon purpureus]